MGRTTVKYINYLKKLLKDDDARLEIGEVFRAYLRGSYLSDCAKRILKKLFKVKDILVVMYIDEKNIRELTRSIRSRYRTPVLVYSSSHYAEKTSAMGYLEKHYMAIIMDTSVILLSVKRFDSEWGDPIYAIDDKIKILQI